MFSVSKVLAPVLYLSFYASDSERSGALPVSTGVPRQMKLMKSLSIVDNDTGDHSNQRFTFARNVGKLHQTRNLINKLH